MWIGIYPCEQVYRTFVVLSASEQHMLLRGERLDYEMRCAWTTG